MMSSKVTPLRVGVVFTSIAIAYASNFLTSYYTRTLSKSVFMPIITMQAIAVYLFAYFVLMPNAIKQESPRSNASGFFGGGPNDDPVTVVYNPDAEDVASQYHEPGEPDSPLHDVDISSPTPVKNHY